MKLIATILFLTFSSLGTLSYAEVRCPWENLKGQDLIRFSYSHEADAELSALDVQEDLACLKILFAHKYVGQDDHPKVNLMRRLNQLSLRATPMKSSELIDLIYNLHAGIPDVHLSYQVHGVTKKYEGPHKKQVQLSESLEAEKIYHRKDFIYFKPAELLTPQLTESQKNFLQLIKNSDTHLVLDLRETQGGGGSFAEDLAKNIFTSDQKIPQTKKHQIKSGLNSIGHAISARIAYGNQAQEYFDSVKSLVENVDFNQLIPYTEEEEVTAHMGQRPLRFTSKILLLVDGTCASECETIVELLSAHRHVKLIGQNTDGALHYSNAVSFVLPHSGIWASLPSLRHIYENDAPEGIGYAPDIVSDFIDLNQLAFED